MEQEAKPEQDLQENEPQNTEAEEVSSELPGESERLAAELAESKDKYLRLYSDFENFRRRTSKEKLEQTRTAHEEVVVALLPVLDDFERALKAMPEAAEGREGITLIHNKLTKILEQRGVRPMEAVGKAFDMELHESITQAPAPSEELKGKVMDEVEKGYYLHEKVIRFAKVIIGA